MKTLFSPVVKKRYLWWQDIWCAVTVLSWKVSVECHATGSVNKTLWVQSSTEHTVHDGSGCVKFKKNIFYWNVICLNACLNALKLYADKFHRSYRRDKFATIPSLTWQRVWHNPICGAARYRWWGRWQGIYSLWMGADKFLTVTAPFLVLCEKRGFF